ncbi:hypothetical protein BCR32DRAFT_265621 [Anaeromyces robustus]|uniref:Periplasmic binding protein-like II n=1 Tax=Anaeromyces robustus TaxID=1754192 RepID=A0A1Y1XI63_9FUNG|nr:hypothetical protein BCR32DRAFT_265621 [Anaeromyces robustus]|eukprot:ORX85450.1 hypothetical protein BCR32DRAFT_265621 [Anaeromyces robustus]
MKLLLFTVFVIAHAFIAKALNTDLQFKYANTIIYEQPENSDEIQILKYKLENVFYIIYDEKFQNSSIYQVGLVNKYKEKYCSDGNSCRFFAKPLKHTAVDSGPLLRFFEYLGVDLVKYLGNVGHITSGCAYKHAQVLDPNSTPDTVPIDGFFHTDLNSKFAETYKEQSIYFNGVNEDTPLAKFEWIKFISVFYGLEKEATDIFESVAIQYLCNKDLIQKNSLFARLRIAWLTSQAPNNEKWITNDYEYVKNLLSDAGATISHEKEITSYKQVKQVLSQSHYLIDISSDSSGEYSINDFYDQYRYDVSDDLNLLTEQNILRNDATRSEEGVSVWENDYMAFPHLVLLDLIYWFHPKLFMEDAYNTNIIKRLYGGLPLNDTLDLTANPASTTSVSVNDTTTENTNDNNGEGNNNTDDNNTVDLSKRFLVDLSKRFHVTHDNSSYWFRNVAKNTNIKTEPNARCPSLLSEYVTNNICLNDVNFSGDYDEYAKFDDVMTQFKNYALIYYPIIGIVGIASIVLAFIFLRIFKKRQLKRKGYNDSQKVLHDTEGFVEF